MAIPPTQRGGEDGIYHVEGDLVVADKEAQYNLYKALKPVLTAAQSSSSLPSQDT